MRAAYADPPYIGCANYYPEKTEVDHEKLIRDLCQDYETWALSSSSVALKQVLSYCPSDVRIAAWVKPFCSFKPGVNPPYCWEPVIFWHPRARGREETSCRDWLAESITLKKGLIGAKPERFCYWIFTLLGLKPDDELADLYPGTGIVTSSWRRYKAAYPELCNYGYEPRQSVMPLVWEPEFSQQEAMIE